MWPWQQGRGHEAWHTPCPARSLCRCGPVPAQMWPGPGADVARSLCRCGPVPVQMWPGPGADVARSRRRCGLTVEVIDRAIVELLGHADRTAGEVAAEAAGEPWARRCVPQPRRPPAQAPHTKYAFVSTRESRLALPAARAGGAGVGAGHYAPCSCGERPPVGTEAAKSAAAWERVVSTRVRAHCGTGAHRHDRPKARAKPFARCPLTRTCLRVRTRCVRCAALRCAALRGWACTGYSGDPRGL
jgi:hypothetical protein